MKLKKIIKFIVFVTATTAVINKAINFLAEAYHKLNIHNKNFYHWRYGDIYYEEIGKGTPILLLHEISTASAGHEWSSIIEELSKTHTVYIPDLLGCGRSEKPDLSYSCVIYSSLISDFINEVIKEPVIVITSATSSSPAIFSAQHNSDIFKKIICINPTPAEGLNQSADVFMDLKAKFLTVPIFGTALYNRYVSIDQITARLKKQFTEDELVTNELVETWHESAHLRSGYPRQLFRAELLHYNTLPVKHILSTLQTPIKLVFGEDEFECNKIAESYSDFVDSDAIEYISSTKHYPQIESPDKITKSILSFIE